MRSIQRLLQGVLLVSLAFGQVACTSTEESATCRRSTSSGEGPGDVSAYFPLGVGSRWYYEAEDSVGGFKSGEPYQVSVEVTGTQPASGATASVFTTSLLGGGGPPSVSLFSKGPSGVSEHAGVEVDPALTQLYPYQVLVFPLTPGAIRELVACQGLDYGQDLDGDGKNERFDVQSTASTVGDEVVAVTAGTFTARRVDTRTSITVRSSSGQAATVEASELTWYAPGIGRVRSSTTIVAGGSSESSEQRLVGFAVDGARQGLVRYAALATDLVPVAPLDSVDRPAIAFDGTGHLLVFPSYPTGAFDQGRLEAEVLRPDGSVARRFDLTDRRGWGLRPEAAFNGANHLVVSTIVSSDPYRSTLFAQRVTPAGDLLDGPTGFDVNDGFDGACAPSIASDGDGWLVACATYAEGLRVARISAGGAVLGTLGLTPPWPSVPGGPGIAYGRGSYLVAWVEDREFGGRILATRVRPDGTVLDAMPIVVSTVPGAPQTLVSVAFDGTRFLLVWGGFRSGETDAYGARVGTDGELIDGPAALGGFPVNAYPGREELPVAAFDGSRFVATWPSAVGIFAARIGGDGMVLDLPLTGPGLAVARPVPSPLGLASGVGVPVVVQAAGGETLFVWVDNPYSSTTRSIRGAWYAW